MTTTQMKHYPVFDFAAIRITCQYDDCGVTMEMALAKVIETFTRTNGSCPLCGRSFLHPDANANANVLVDLARTVTALGVLTTQVQVQFPVPVKEG